MSDGCELEVRFAEGSLRLPATYELCGGQVIVHAEGVALFTSRVGDAEGQMFTSDGVRFGPCGPVRLNVSKVRAGDLIRLTMTMSFGNEQTT